MICATHHAVKAPGTIRAQAKRWMGFGMMGEK
jgi:hypothetical protein